MSYVDTNNLDGFEVHLDGTQVEIVCPVCRDGISLGASPAGLRELVLATVDHECTGPDWMVDD